MIGCVDVTDMLATEMAADLGDEGAACVAERLDDDLIREMMIVGFRDDEPPPAGIIDAMFECGAIADLMQAQFEAQFGAEGAQCLVDSLGEDALRAMIEASMRGETPGAASVAAVQAATVACGLAPG
jgi:hypothetical protein